MNHFLIFAYLLLGATANKTSSWVFSDEEESSVTDTTTTTNTDILLDSTERQERKIEDGPSENIEGRFFIKDKLCLLGLASCSNPNEGHGAFPGSSQVQYVQPVKLVAHGAPIPAIPLAHGSYDEGPFKPSYNPLKNHGQNSYNSHPLLKIPSKFPPISPPHHSPSYSSPISSVSRYNGQLTGPIRNVPSYKTNSFQTNFGAQNTPTIHHHIHHHEGSSEHYPLQSLRKDSLSPVRGSVLNIPLSPGVGSQFGAFKSQTQGQLHQTQQGFSSQHLDFSSQQQQQQHQQALFQQQQQQQQQQSLFQQQQGFFDGLREGRRDGCICVLESLCPSFTRKIHSQPGLQDYSDLINPRVPKTEILAEENDVINLEKAEESLSNRTSKSLQVSDPESVSVLKVSEDVIETSQGDDGVHFPSRKRRDSRTGNSFASSNGIPASPCATPNSGYVCCSSSSINPTSRNENSVSQLSQVEDTSFESSNTGQCGKRHSRGITGRVASKNPSGSTEFAEYPWQVAILQKDTTDNVYICGGSLVDGSHILTAAHCVTGYAPKELLIRLGEWDVNNDSEFYTHIEFDVTSIFTHPDFYSGNLINDISLLRFKGYVDFPSNPHISPICLPDKNNDFSGQNCFVSGWGKDAFKEGNYQHVLREVNLPVISNPLCEKLLRGTRLGPDFDLDSGFLCAGGEEGRDACKGDGGGPLVCLHDGLWQLAGIVSWGLGCGQSGVPGVYVKVSEYQNWIQSQLLRRL